MDDERAAASSRSATDSARAAAVVVVTAVAGSSGGVATTPARSVGRGVDASTANVIEWCRQHRGQRDDAGGVPG